MRRTVIALLVMSLAAGTAFAQAKDKPAADAAFADGQQRYAAGEYLPAAVKFELAYSLDPDPAYLFNIAQAYRLGDACAKAGAYYRKFLGAVSSAPNLAKVQQYIEQSDACAAVQAKGTPTLPPPTGNGVVTPPAGPPGPGPGPVDSPSPSKTTRILGISGLVVGGLGLGLGVYFTLEVGKAEDDREAFAREGLAWDQAAVDAINDRGDRAALFAKVSYIVGGAAILGGAALLVFGTPSERTRAVSLVPTGDGAMAVGAFHF